MSDTLTLNYRNSAEVRAKGLEALTASLGTIGTIYFLRQFSGGTGDWTKERQGVLENTTVESFEQDLALLRQLRSIHSIK